jgi:hypothetical protein
MGSVVHTKSESLMCASEPYCFGSGRMTHDTSSPPFSSAARWTWCRSPLRLPKMPDAPLWKVVKLWKYCGIVTPTLLQPPTYGVYLG